MKLPDQHESLNLQQFDTGVKQNDRVIQPEDYIALKFAEAGSDDTCSIGDSPQVCNELKMVVNAGCCRLGWATCALVSNHLMNITRAIGWSGKHELRVWKMHVDMHFSFKIDLRVKSTIDGKWNVEAVASYIFHAE